MQLELKIEKVAHGGVFVARPEGKVVFVEGTLPDEVVRAQIIDEKSKNVISLIQNNIEKYHSVAFANSLGAEDMVLVDLIQRNRLDVEIFSIDTGRLPPETYNLIQKTEEKYQFTIKLYFPNQEKVETYVNTNGINAFYSSLDLRKACCAIRKVEPLNRALKNKKASQ